MIRRPTKRFGGALQEEFDKLWDAIVSAQVVSAPGYQLDKTTQGTVLRPAKTSVAREEPAGAFFKVTNAGAGGVFNVRPLDADGSPPPYVVTGGWGAGNKMLSPYSRVDPKGINETPAFDNQEHILLWELPSTAMGAWPTVGTVVFAVKTSFNNCFTGYTQDGKPIYGVKTVWRVISTTAAPIVIETGSVAITLVWPLHAAFVLGDPVILSADLDTSATYGAHGEVHFIAKGGPNSPAGRIIMADANTSSVMTTMEADMEFGVTVIAHNSNGTVGDTDDIGFYIDPSQPPPVVTSVSFSPTSIIEGGWTDLTISYTGFPHEMEIKDASGNVRYSGDAGYDGTGVVTQQQLRIPYVGGNGTWTVKLTNPSGESSGTASLDVTPYDPMG